MQISEKRRTRLEFFRADDRSRDACGESLIVEASSHDLSWPGVLIEKGWAPHFYPTNVVTPYFYFALARDADLRWTVRREGALSDLHTVPGEIWINPPWTPFTHKVDEACFFTILAIEEDALYAAHSEVVDRRRLEFLNNYNVSDLALKNFLELFLLEAEAGGPSGRRYLQSLLGAFSAYFLAHYSSLAGGRGDPVGRAAARISPEQIHELAGFIQSNLAEPLSIEDLAAELNMSKFYFLKEFKKSTGVTPYQFLIELRMKRAEELLRNSAMALADLALHLGFSDQSHFSRAFKAYSGASPAAYRKRASR
jgi:AraC family transcriptional regulator